MTKLVDEYSYSIAFSPQDRAFIGRVAEWPSLAAHGPSGEAALREIRSVVEACLEDMEASGEVIPEPLSRRTFSGKLLLRLPTDLHRFLALEAEREGTSLNQLIATHLGGLRGVASSNESLSAPPSKRGPVAVRSSTKAKATSGKANSRIAHGHARKARRG
jgi:predicted HicB family RNase H-like nuclease